MTDPEFKKAIDNAIMKVIDMNINRGYSQYMGRGMNKKKAGYEDISTEYKQVMEQPYVPLKPYLNINDKVYRNKAKAVRQDMADIMKVADCYGYECNGGALDKELIKKHLNKIKEHIRSRLKDRLLAEASSESSDDAAEKMLAVDNEGEAEGGLMAGKKLSKTGRKKRKDAGKKRQMTAGQLDWQKFVNKVANKPQYKGMPRSQIVKIASELRKAKME